MLGSLTKTFKKILGSKEDRDLKGVMPLVNQIKEVYPSMEKLSNDELRAKTAEFKSKINDFIAPQNKEVEELKKKVDETADFEAKEALYEEIDKIEKSVDQELEKVLLEILPEAFAVVKETAKRFTENEEVEVSATEMDQDIAAKREQVEIRDGKAFWKNEWNAAGAVVKWDMIHYDVQLIGGIALHSGKIAEMATGEGKTLVATLPVYLNALTGRGVHLVTVNDYLARRDAEWMGPLFEFHGLTIDCIDNHQPNSPERRKAYQADITYGTNNEFGFDYLRDNMSRTPEELVQRKHHYAIIDEVDSVLIDDARTPLIISGPTPKGDKHEFNEMKPLVEKLVTAQKQLVSTFISDSKKKLSAEVENSKEQKKLQDEGGMALLRSFRGLPRNKALIKFLSESGIKAQLQKTENFYMQDQNKEMHKVDAELYFVIDEKSNSIELTEKGIELISGSDKDKEFFVLPDINIELSNIDKSSASDEEKVKVKDQLIQDYSVKAERIHTVNQLLKAYTLFEKDTEYVVMDNKVKIVDEQTGRIMEGRRYSDGLHQAIESKENVKVEAATQTYATVTLQNYFRMYHKLSGMTGTAETEAGELWDIYELDVMVIPTNRPIARDDRQDLVFKTTREKYNAVADEIVSLVKAGRPVLVGTTSVEISELLSRMLKMKNIKHNVLNAKLHQKEADIVAEAGNPGTVTIATNMAGRGTDIKLSKEVKDAGGLAIIGTERHESRRVDRQLRGRAGRQGDPGSSQFYVSLEDNLMRLFGSDRIASLMDRMGIEEGEVIQHSMITKSIERAQKKVEENNFGVRKRLLEYDDVMNSQREVIYKRRKHALFGERLKVDISNMIYDTTASLVDEAFEMKDYENFRFDLIRTLSIESPLNEQELFSKNPEEVVPMVYNKTIKHYETKSKNLAASAYPVIKNVYEEQNSYQNIVVPFTDGIKSLQVITPLEEAYNSQGKNLIDSFEKNITLAMIDDAWKEHLREMDDLKQSVQGAVYEQKDPLLIYKFEAFELFKQMIDRTNKEIVSFLIKGNLPQQQQNPQLQEAPQTSRPTPNLQTSRTEVPQFSGGEQTRASGGETDTATQQKPKTQPVRVEKKVGRNEPCPCGSGKKFKQCHGK